MEANKLFGSRQFREELAYNIDAAYEAYLEGIWSQELQDKMRREFREFLDWLSGVDE